MAIRPRVLGGRAAPNSSFWRREALATGHARVDNQRVDQQPWAIRVGGSGLIVRLLAVPPAGYPLYAGGVETLTYLFTDIEGSTALLASMGDEAWLAVLRRHDSTLRSLFAEHRGEVYTGTGDGFFIGFPSVDSSMACALAIQSAIDEVRVRIGVHFAEANRDSGGISGRGVHEAARISALGAGGEIVASTATLALATGKIRSRAVRTVVLKGLPGEMEVATLQFDALV